jgi:hypothetical protein
MKPALVCALCMLMVDQPLLQGSVVKRGPTAGNPPTKGESRVEHSLDRLTFGPRPGDVAAVEAMGLDTWFEMQLNPSKIDDSALNVRLAQFPAMQLPQQELMARYPSQQMVRQMAQRQAFAPADAVEHAIYADQMEFYRLQQARQAAKTVRWRVVRQRVKRQRPRLRDAPRRQRPATTAGTWAYRIWRRWPREPAARRAIARPAARQVPGRCCPRKM